MATAPRRGKIVEPGTEPETVSAPVLEEEAVEVEETPAPAPKKTRAKKTVEPVVEEEEEDDGLLFPNGPSMAQVEAWKNQHGDVYVTTFNEGEHYIWRTMTRFEYRKLVKQLEQLVASNQVSQAEANMNNEESICELCLLWPQRNRVDMAQDMAGVASIISQEILEASAFVALEVRQL